MCFMVNTYAGSHATFFMNSTAVALTSLLLSTILPNIFYVLDFLSKRTLVLSQWTHHLLLLMPKMAGTRSYVIEMRVPRLQVTATTLIRVLYVPHFDATFAVLVCATLCVGLHLHQQVTSNVHFPAGSNDPYSIFPRCISSNVPNSLCSTPTYDCAYIYDYSYDYDYDYDNDYDYDYVHDCNSAYKYVYVHDCDCA